MPGGFAPRFAIEAGFLILLGVGAGLADLRTAVIVALLAGAWVLVSLFELAVWRAEGRPAARAVPPAPPPEQPTAKGWTKSLAGGLTRRQDVRERRLYEAAGWSADGGRKRLPHGGVDAIAVRCRKRLRL